MDNSHQDKWSLRILIVGSNDRTISQIKHKLATSGMDSLLIETAHSALEALGKSFQHTFDLIFVLSDLARDSSYTLINQFKRVFHESKILLVSNKKYDVFFASMLADGYLPLNTADYTQIVHDSMQRVPEL